MKKLIFILLAGLLAFTVESKAQSATLLPLAAGDTLAQSASSDTVTKTIRVTAPAADMGIQVVMTKLSGTASGKAYLYGSLDGTNYVISDSSSAFTDVTTNVAQFSKSPVPWTYYRVQVRPMGAATGTQSSIVRVYFVTRNRYK